jgi:ATP-dependent RNA helicase RhlE
MGAEKMTFEDLKLNKQLLSAIDELGYTRPSAIQQKVIPQLLGGQDVIGIAPTGTGKTAAFVLPILMKLKYAQGDAVRTLILAPSKELALQITEDVEQLAKNTDLRFACIYGGVGPKAQIERIAEGLDILVATPGRFMDLYLRGSVNLRSLKFMVLDEADKLMDMGFMPQLRQVLEVVPRKRQNLLFSATFSPRVEELSTEFLENPLKIEIEPQATTVDTIEQRYILVPNTPTKLNLLKHLLNQDEYARVMIFVNTKTIADSVFKFLDRKLEKVVHVIHSNKGQNSRINSVKEFEAGNVQVLVTTDVSARGIDIDDVTHVFNFEAPKVYVDYVHRVGRTGRAEKEGIAITLVNDAELLHLKKVEELIRMEITPMAMPEEVEIEKTKKGEEIEINRQIDKVKRKEDPDFKGAFHEKKFKNRFAGVGSKKPKKVKKKGDSRDGKTSIKKQAKRDNKRRR